MSATPNVIPIRVTRRFAASPERVFDAWLDPDGARRWLFATPTGQVVRAEMDARVGGRWTVVDRRPEGDALHTGTYVAIERPRRLAFTFAVAQGEAGDPVTVTIAPRDAGCELALVHEMQAEWADYADRTREGWQKIVDGLARTLGE